MLRPVRKSDAGLFALYAGDRRVAEATRIDPAPAATGAAEAFVARMMSGAGPESAWVMDGSASGLAEVLGVISLKAMDRGPVRDRLIGWHRFLECGFASEAVRALVQANPLQSRTIFAEVFQDNPGSARVLKIAASSTSATRKASAWPAMRGCRPGPI